jgi:hypothetical protein
MWIVVQREQKKPKLGKRYFGNNKLDDIIVNYPHRKKMSQEELDEGSFSPRSQQ